MDTKDSTRGQRNMVNAKRKRKEEKTRKFVIITYIFLPSYLFCLFLRPTLVLLVGNFWHVFSGLRDQRKKKKKNQDQDDE